jgi:lysophospholipase L1-like esterase
MNLHDVSGFDWKVHTTDGCHPNIEGHRWLAEKIGEAVNKLL